MPKKKFPFPLINTHTHAAMVAFRGMAEDLPLDKWLNEYIWPKEKAMVSPQFVYKETKKAISEMKKNGIAAFCDMYFFAEEIAKAAKEQKMKALIGEGILDFPTASSQTPFEALERTEKLIKKYKNDPYVSIAVAPHSIYAVSPEILIKAKELARKYKTIYHIHLAETKKEFDDCYKKNKLTPVEYLDKLGVLDEKTILAHCVWLKEKDMEIIAKRKASVAHCPLSNLKLGSGIAPIAQMIEKGINVTLGTDGAASSNRLDIWEAGKIAALIQKGSTHNPTELPAKKVVEMMSVNGMKALGIKKIDGKTINDYKKEIRKTDNFNFLYELNVSDLQFS